MADELFIIDVDERKGTASVKAFRGETALMVQDMGRAAASLERMEAQLDDVARAGTKAKRGQGDLRQSIIAVDSAFNLASRSAGFLSKSVNLLSKPVRIAIDAQSGVNAIRTLSDKIGPELEAQLRKLPAQIGQTTQQTLRSAYDALSAGIREENLVGTLKQAGDLARAGQADLTDTLSLLRVSLKAYEGAGIDATTASDILFATVRKGVTTIPDLAASFGNVVGIGAQYGASMQEVTAATAELTKIAPTTAEAVTQLSALFKAIAAPSAKAQKTLKGLGVEFGIGAIKAKGLTGILDDLHRATGGNAEVLGTLFQRQEATRGLLTLLANDQAGYRDALEATTKAAGETARATGIMNQGAAGALNRFNALKEQALIEIGDKVLPILVEELGRLIEWFDRDGDRFLRDFTDGLKTLASGIQGLARTAGPFISNFGKPIVGLLGVLLAQSLIGRAAQLTGGLLGVAKAITPVGVASNAAALGVGRMATAIGGLSAALPLLAVVAKRIGDELGQVMTAGDRVEQRFLEITNRIQALQLQTRLGGFESAEALQARRQAIFDGDQVLVDPTQIDEARGVLTRSAVEAVVGIGDIMNRGLEDAAQILDENLLALDRAATIQRQKSEERLDQLAEAQAKLRDIENDIIRAAQGGAVSSLKASFGLAQRRGQLAQQIETLSKQADTARLRAARLEETRANLAVKFQREAQSRMESILSLLRNSAPTLAGIGAGITSGVRDVASGRVFAPRLTDEEKKRRAERAEARRRFTNEQRIGALRTTIERDLATLAEQRRQSLREAAKLGVRSGLVNLRFDRERAALLEREEERRRQIILTATAATEAARVDAIADAGDRALAAQALRFDRELAQADRAGADIFLVLEAQGRKESELRDRLASEARDSRLEAARQEAQFITDSTAQRLVLLDLERTSTLDRLAEQGQSTVAAAQYFEAERTRVLQEGVAERINAMRAEVSAVGTLANNLASIGDLMNGAAARQTGAGILLRSIALGAEAFSAQAEAVIEFGRGNFAGFAALQSGALLGFARAAQLESRGKALGASGGSGFSGSGGATPGAVGPGTSTGPSPQQANFGGQRDSFGAPSSGSDGRPINISIGVVAGDNGAREFGRMLARTVHERNNGGTAFIGSVDR